MNGSLARFLLTGAPTWLAAPVGLAALVLGTAACALTALTAAGGTVAWVAAASYLPVAVFVFQTAPGQHPFPRFGAANTATLARAVLACLVFGLAADPGGMAGAGWPAWLPSGAAALALLLDLADGGLARRQGLESAFGRRFDIEVDAGMVLALASLAVAAGAAPAWALLIGLLRYGFLGAGRVLPALAAPLAPSLRRRLAGGGQTVALAVVLAPVVPPAATAAIAAVALTVLGVSFALDIRTLLGGATPSR